MLDFAKNIVDSTVKAASDAFDTGRNIAETAVKTGSTLLEQAVRLPIDLVTKPKLGFEDFVSVINPPFTTFPGIFPGFEPKPAPTNGSDFESNYGGLIDAINTLSDQINDKKAQLEDPNLTPEQRMQLAIELQELMQMRLQMITMTTNLLKAEHDSNMAITNNLRG